MPTMLGLDRTRIGQSDDRAPITVRFCAPDGATVAVTLADPPAPENTARALDLARRTIADLAAAQAGNVRARSSRPAGCDAAYWSWALPPGWTGPSR